MDLGLKGKVAIVTGGTQGIGRATSMLLARERAAGGRVAPVQADVSKAPDCERLVAETLAAFGRALGTDPIFSLCEKMGSVPIF